MMNHRAYLEGLFQAGVDAVHPRNCLSGRLPKNAPKGRTIVLGAGKAAAAMAEVAAAELHGDVSGCVVTRHGHGALASTGKIEIIEASHPVPDENSHNAGQRIRAMAEAATANDRVIFLISGGGSALLCDPIDGLSLAEKAALTNALVKSGVPIEDINLVRRHLSKVKGGRLTQAAAPAELWTYVISDVVGDDPVHVASGPSIASEFAPEKVLDILEQIDWPIAEVVRKQLLESNPVNVPDHPVQVIATAHAALDVIKRIAENDGWQVHDLGTELIGSASQTGREQADLAMEYALKPGRHLLLSGGELTVKVKSDNGKGGPNLEYLAGLLSGLKPSDPICALAGDTDGIDGTEDNAGGYVTASWSGHPDINQVLAANRTYDLFAELGALIITGPTRTNVNDIRMIAVEGRA